jgi:hypothetical protein
MNEKVVTTRVITLMHAVVEIFVKAAHEAASLILESLVFDILHYDRYAKTSGGVQ